MTAALYRWAHTRPAAHALTWRQRARWFAPIPRAAVGVPAARARWRPRLHGWRTLAALTATAAGAVYGPRPTLAQALTLAAGIALGASVTLTACVLHYRALHLDRHMWETDAHARAEAADVLAGQLAARDRKIRRATIRTRPAVRGLP